MRLPNLKHFCGTIFCGLGPNPQKLIPQKLIPHELIPQKLMDLGYAVTGQVYNIKMNEELNKLFIIWSQYKVDIH